MPACLAVCVGYGLAAVGLPGASGATVLVWWFLCGACVCESLPCCGAPTIAPCNPQRRPVSLVIFGYARGVWVPGWGGDERERSGFFVPGAMVGLLEVVAMGPPRFVVAFVAGWWELTDVGWFRGCGHCRRVALVLAVEGRFSAPCRRRAPAGCWSGCLSGCRRRPVAPSGRQVPAAFGYLHLAAWLCPVPPGGALPIARCPPGGRWIVLGVGDRARGNAGGRAGERLSRCEG